MRGMLRRGRRLPRTHPQVLSAVCIVLLLAGGSVALVRATGHRSHQGEAKVVVAPVPLDSPLPTESAQPVPSETAHVAASSSPTTVTPTGGTLPVSAAPSLTPASPKFTECVGPLPPGHRAEAKCDVGKHQGLPPNCRWDGTCAWWDSWGAVPGGPSEVPIHVRPDGSLDVSWAVGSQQLVGNDVSGPLKDFYLRVHDDDHDTVVIWARELGLDSRSTTVSGLRPGTYTVCIMELNDSGLGGLCPGAVTVPPPSSPSPGATPSPSSTATS